MKAMKGGIYKPGREASEETNPAHIFALVFSLERAIGKDTFVVESKKMKKKKIICNSTTFIFNLYKGPS